MVIEIPQRPGLLLNDESLRLNDKPADTPIVPQNKELDLDESDLASYILELFRNDIEDKRQMSWVDKRNYDIKAYYGLKDAALSQIPWPNASNFPVPLTPTILDTAHANIVSSIFDNPSGPVRVKGVSVEDKRVIKPLEELLNWQALNESEIEREMDKTVFRTFLHGVGYLKVFWDFTYKKIKVFSLDIGNVFLPIDAKGVSVEETDHIIHVVPLGYNDIQIRKANGTYKYPDQILPGDNIEYGAAFEEKMQKMDEATGTSLTTRLRRETYFIAECFLSYSPKSGSGYGSGPTRAGVKPREIIVSISPYGGKIQRKIANDREIRPFADFHAYYHPDRYFSMSLPEKIRNIQEKIDYADKQNTDALDVAISPSLFVDDTSSFEGGSAQRVPGGIYPKGRGNTVEWSPSPPVDRGFERQISLLWEQAERLTGIIDITQGRASSFGGKTLGEVEIRAARADIRFKTIYKRFEKGWKDTWNLIYEFDNEYMERSKKVRILGYDNFKSIDELFPVEENRVSGFGLTGKFDFLFSGGLINEKDLENQKIIAFTEAELLSPLVLGNKGNLWKVEERRALAFGIDDFETMVEKPIEAKIFSVEEFVQRIVSGEKDIQIRPGINTESYIFDLQLFMKTDTFRHLPPEQKKQVRNTLTRAFIMSVGEKRALLDLETIKTGMRNRIGAPLTEKQVAPNVPQETAIPPIPEQQMPPPLGI